MSIRNCVSNYDKNLKNKLINIYMFCCIRKKKEKKVFFCDKCQTFFYSSKQYKEHKCSQYTRLFVGDL